MLFYVSNQSSLIWNKIIQAPTLDGTALVGKIASLTILFAVPLNVEEYLNINRNWASEVLYSTILEQGSVVPRPLGIIVVARNSAQSLTAFQSMRLD